MSRDRRSWAGGHLWVDVPGVSMIGASASTANQYPVPMAGCGIIVSRPTPVGPESGEP